MGDISSVSIGNPTKASEINACITAINAEHDGDTGAHTAITCTSIQIANSGLLVLDTDASHALKIKPGSNLTSLRTLTITTGDADRTLTLSGNLTVESASIINQDLTTDANAIFATIQVGNQGLLVLDTNASHALRIAPGSDLTGVRTLTITTGDADRTVTLSGNPTLNDWFDQSTKQAASPTFAACSLGTGELTCGSINRGAGTLTLEIGGTAEISITSTTSTFGGNIVIPDAGTIGSASDTDAISIAADGDVGINEAASTYKLSVVTDEDGWVARFFNDGNNANRNVLNLQGGADNGLGTTDYCSCFDGDGDAVGYLRNDAGTFDAVDASDRSLKNIIGKADFNGINIIKNIPIMDFEYKKRPGKIKTGFVADDIEPIYPAAVSIDSNGLKGIARSMLVIPLWKAIQEIDSRLSILEAA